MSINTQRTKSTAFGTLYTHTHIYINIYKLHLVFDYKLYYIVSVLLLLIKYMLKKINNGTNNSNQTYLKSSHV